MSSPLITSDVPQHNSGSDIPDNPLSGITIGQQLLVAQAVHQVKPIGPVDETIDWARVAELLHQYKADYAQEDQKFVILDQEVDSYHLIVPSSKALKTTV